MFLYSGNADDDQAQGALHSIDFEHWPAPHQFRSATELHDQALECAGDISRFFPRIDRIFSEEALNPFFSAQDEGFSEFRSR